MSTDLYVALSGALGHMRELEVMANNLANAGTVGFKRDRTAFVSALESALASGDGGVTRGAAGRVFADVGSERFDARPGPIETTGAPLDVAIEGSGYFPVETPDGTRYTRAGSFAVDAEGQLVTRDGFPVLGDGAPIQVGRAGAEIRSDGRVVAPSRDLAEPPAVLGQLSIVDFAEEVALQKQGANLFRAEDGAEPIPVDDAELAERSVERSNVEPARELASLVLVQRSFDVAMQMLQADDEISRRLIQEVSS